MDIFYLTLKQMLIMFTFIVIGFILKKKRILPEKADVTMSRLETYILVPALNIYSFMTNCTVETIKANTSLIIYGGIIVICAMALSYPLSALFVRNHKDNFECAYERCIYQYAITFGNYGFVGNFIVLGIWGQEGLFKYLVFTFIVGLFCIGWGVVRLIPKGKEALTPFKALLKRFFNPPMVGLIIGIILGIFNLQEYIPEFIKNTLSNASDCMGPVSMILAGVVIGGFDVLELLKKKKVYVATLLRLIIIPAVIVLVLKAFNVDKEVITYALVAFGTPLGLNTIVYPAAYGGETKTGASMTIISSTLSVITIPLMYLLLVVML